MREPLSLAAAAPSQILVKRLMVVPHEPGVLPGLLRKPFQDEPPWPVAEDGVVEVGPGRNEPDPLLGYAEERSGWEYR